MSKLINYDKLKVCTKDDENDMEEIVSDNFLQIKKDSLIPDIYRDQITDFMLDLYKTNFEDPLPTICELIFGKNKKIRTKEEKFKDEFVRLRRIHKIHPKKAQLYYMYRIYVYKNLILPNPHLEELFITKRMRSQSGVLVISVIMPPNKFSCSYDCYYCPNDPSYSRSYYRGEPTVMRGARNKFDSFLQFYDRAMTYFINGHHIDKVEIIILGGTFSCYNSHDAENFIKNIFYAANTIFDDRTNLRLIRTIEEEIIVKKTHKKN